LEKKMDEIKISNLEVFCHHGVYPEENVLGQKFVVDATLYLSVRKAGLSDALSDSVSYGDVCRLITAEMKKQNDQLLEKVAERLAEQILLSFPLVHGIKIEVKKPWAPVMMHVDHTAVCIKREWHRVYVGAGSNLGDREQYLQEAEKQIREDRWNRSFAAAKIIETKPYGYLAQDDFLNTVFTFETLYEPEELLDVLHGMEQRAHRTREIHWGPRTLDLDILLYDDRITEDRNLVLPHPEMTKRRFVLEPLCELNPYGVHPLYRERYKDLLERLHEQEKQ